MGRSINLPYDLSSETFTLFSQYLKENEKGVMHVQRQLPPLEKSFLSEVITHDLFMIQKALGAIERYHVSQIRDGIWVSSLTLRLKNGRIVKYFATANDAFTPYLTFNISQRGHVIEYDNRYLRNIQTSFELDNTCKHTLNIREDEILLWDACQALVDAIEKEVIA